MNQLISLSVEDQLVKDRLNKQHLKVEQEIKKYDEILKKNRNMRGYEAKRKDYRRDHHVANHNSSHIDQSIEPTLGAKDLIKINGVKLDNKNLDLRRGGRADAHNNSSILDPLPKQNRLPALGILPGKNKVLLAKYNRLR